MIKQGCIYLANLNPTKPGKVRPVFVIQSDFLNEIDHPTVIVIPLSTRLIDDSYPLRQRLNKREDLHQNSDLLIDQIRAIDIKRITSNCIATATNQEMLKIETAVKALLNMYI